MWELDYECWAQKNWCFWTVVLEKILESPLNCKEIKLVNPKGDQSWLFIRRTDAEAEAPVLWPSDVKSWILRKDPDAGKDSRQEEKGATEDEMVGWHHRLDGHELEQVGSWWWTEKPGVLQSMVSHSWATKQQQWTTAHQAPVSMGFPRQNTGVSCHLLHQGVSLNQGSNSSLCIGRWMSHLIHWSHLGSPHSEVMFLNKLMDSQNDSLHLLWWIR